MFDASAVALLLGLASLWLGITAIWLVVNFAKRVLAEAKQLIDATTTAIWKTLASVERSVKSLATNQREMAGELSRLRENVRDLDTRVRDLQGRAASHRQEIDHIHGRITAITRVLTTFAPVPEFHDDAPEPPAAAEGGDSTFEKLRRASGQEPSAAGGDPSRQVG